MTNKDKPEDNKECRICGKPTEKDSFMILTWGFKGGIISKTCPQHANPNIII